MEQKQLNDNSGGLVSIIDGWIKYSMPNGIYMQFPNKYNAKLSDLKTQKDIFDLYIRWWNNEANKEKDGIQETYNFRNMKTRVILN